MSKQCSIAFSDSHNAIETAELYPEMLLELVEKGIKLSYTLQA